MLLIVAALKLLVTRRVGYLLLATLLNAGLIVLNPFWQQTRLFQGYELAENTNTLDAMTGKCYLFYGPHDGVLLLTFLMSAIILWILAKNR